MTTFVLDKIGAGAATAPGGKRVAGEAKVLLSLFGCKQIFSNLMAHVRLLWLRIDGSVSGAMVVSQSYLANSPWCSRYAEFRTSRASSKVLKEPKYVSFESTNI